MLTTSEPTTPLKVADPETEAVVFPSYILLAPVKPVIVNALALTALPLADVVTFTEEAAPPPDKVATVVLLNVETAFVLTARIHTLLLPLATVSADVLNEAEALVVDTS
jgi:hypothetical protein